MITCKEDLYGTEFIIESKDESILLEAKCIELGIEKATWSGCEYKNGVMLGMISKDLGTPHSKKLIFTSKILGGDTMDEFLSLKRLTLEDLKPQTKEVEWANGDEVMISVKSKSKWFVVGVSPVTDTSTICVANTGELRSFHTDQLKKPETEAERKEREEVEAASYLLSDWFNAIGKDMPEWSSVNEDVKAHYLRIVRKTNYKVKESE